MTKPRGILTKLVIVTVLTIVVMLPASTSRAGDGGYPSHGVNYVGECWDGQLWAARYENVNWQYTDGSAVVHSFPSVWTLESWVCSGDVASSSGYSSDGWRMVVTNYTSATVYNAASQQVYP